MATGANVDIDQSTLIRTGATLRFYDYGAGEYRSGLATANQPAQGHDGRADRRREERAPPHPRHRELTARAT
ncbi:MAG TPA: hypothetical protein VLF16_06760 [Pseudomonas sp.]|nr:hypothetical protein [Pseudomonas sp.]